MNADHSFEAVKRDLQQAIDVFPNAQIIGDDWHWDGVRMAAIDVAKQHRKKIEVLGTALSFRGCRPA